jgi:hypothetical protein
VKIIPLSDKFQGLQARFIKGELLTGNRPPDHIQVVFTNPLLRHISTTNWQGERTANLNHFLFFPTVFQGAKSLGVSKMAQKFSVNPTDEAWLYLEDLYDELKSWLEQQKETRP